MTKHTKKSGKKSKNLNFLLNGQNPLFYSFSTFLACLVIKFFSYNCCFMIVAKTFFFFSQWPRETVNKWWNPPSNRVTPPWGMGNTPSRPRVWATPPLGNTPLGNNPLGNTHWTLIYQLHSLEKSKIALGSVLMVEFSISPLIRRR